MMSHQRIGLLPRAALALLACLACLGCARLGIGQTGGKLAIRSQAELKTVLQSGFETGLYRFDDKNNATIVLFNGPPENPAQAVTIRLFWQPRGGKTPIDQTATNATIHYVIFTGAPAQQAGVYSGAGFVYPKNSPGGARLQGSVWEADLVLQDSSSGFKDLLGQAKLTGSFAVRRDDAGTLGAIRRLELMVRQRLGYPRLVERDGGSPAF